MENQKTRRVVTIVAAILIILIACSFFGWYWWLKRQQAANSAVTAGRGLGGGIPAFSGGSLGSTNLNISSSFENGSGTSTVPAKTQERQLSTTTPVAWRVSTTPAAAISITSQGGRHSAMIVERVSGNVFSVDPLTGEAIRVTNTLIPTIYDALWINPVDVLLRSMNEQGLATTFLGHIKAATSSPVGEMAGEFLDTRISAVAAKPDGTAFFAIYPVVSGYIGVIKDSLNTKETRVWESVAGGWRAYWRGSTITLVQHASEGVYGSVYSIDPETRNSRVLLQGVAGLSASVRGDDSAIIYSESYVDSFNTYLKTATGTRTLAIKTLGEKCAWSPQAKNIAICAVPQSLGANALPDAWYAGAAHFNDTLWLVDAQTGELRELMSPGSFFGVPVDVKNPTIDATGLFLTFIDANNNTPWILRISEL